MLGLLQTDERSTDHYRQGLIDRGLVLGQDFNVVSFDFTKVNELLPNISDELLKTLRDEFQHIALEDINGLIVPNITLHEAIDHLTSEIDLNFEVIHAIHGAASHMSNLGIREAMIIGSAYTMTHGYCRDLFECHNIKVVAPSDDDVKIIDQRRIEIFNQENPKKHLDWIKQYALKKGGDMPVVLACSEFNTLNMSNERIVNMSSIQMDEAIWCQAK